MTLEDVIAESKDFNLLCDEIKLSKAPKSLLLICRDGDYAFNFAKLLSISFVNDGVFEKNDHFKKLQAGTHPDVKIYPTKEKLLVSDSEEITFESFVKPISADKKIFIIRNIDNSMEAAQNKLLKILEEPPKGVIFILTCQNSNLVLPTIRSRCYKKELGKLPTNKIEELLLNKNQSLTISAISDGYVAKAINLDNTQNFEQIFNLSLSILTKMDNSKQILNYSKQVSAYKEHINLIIEILLLILEDLLILKTGEKNLIHLTQYSSFLEDKCESYTIKSICEIQKLLDNASKTLNFNTNFSIVIENLLLDILEVKYLCR